MSEPWTAATSVLWQMANEPDEERARQLRAHARDLGATALDIARWTRARDEYLYGAVQTLHTSGGAA